MTTEKLIGELRKMAQEHYDDAIERSVGEDGRADKGSSEVRAAEKRAAELEELARQFERET